MKKVLLLLTVVTMILVMVACTPPHTHTVTGELIVVKEATCGDDGLAHMFCTGCGEIVNTITISKTNDHTVVVLPREEPTCEISGLTEGKVCSTCNKVLVKQQNIPASHAFDDWKTIEEATKTEDGSAERYCTVCGKYETMVLHHTGSIGLQYTLSNDRKSYSVTGIGTCTDTDVVIPEVYKGLPVIAIGYCAFYDCYSITSVVIGESVRGIGSGAFENCEFLINVEIGNSVVVIGDSAFNHCHALEKLDISDSVVSIGSYAFNGCYALTMIEIPASVENIGDSAFSLCYSLTYIEVDANNNYYKSLDGNLYTKDGETILQYAIAKTDESFVIPGFVKYISERAFQGAWDLKSVVIPDGVVSIGDCAFLWTGIRNIEFPASLIYLGSDAMPTCQNIVVNENNDYYKSLDGNLYSKDGKNLIKYASRKLDTSFIIPDFVTQIGDYAFDNCDSLTSIVIPSSVTSIGSSAFYGCQSLTSITFEGTVEQWNTIEKEQYWNLSAPDTEVICSDGVVSLK